MSDLRETQDYLAEVIADRDRLRAALERIADLTPGLGGTVHGPTKQDYAQSFGQAQDIARAALAGDAKPEPRELLCDTCAAPLGIMAEPGMHGTCSRCAAKPASAPHRIPEVNDRADANLASMDAEDAARFRWLCEDHADRALRHLRNSLIERMSVMSLSAVRAAIDIHLKNRLEPPHKPGTCQQCGRYLDRRGRCRFPEHNA